MLMQATRNTDKSDISSSTRWRRSRGREWRTTTVAINLLLDPPIGDRESVRQWAAGRPADPVTD